MLKVTRNHVYPDFWKPTAWTWANCFILPQKNWKTHNFTWGTESSQHCDRLFNEVKWPGLWNLDIIGANAGEAGAERSAGKGLFGYLQTDWFTSKFTMKHLLIIAARHGKWAGWAGLSLLLARPAGQLGIWDLPRPAHGRAQILVTRLFWPNYARQEVVHYHI